VSVEDITGIVAAARESLPGWLTRPLEERWAAVILLGVPVTVAPDETAEPVIGVGILPDGGLRILGVWPDAGSVDIGRRGAQWASLLLADSEDIALAALEDGFDADVVDTETLGVVRMGLADVPREDLRPTAAGIGEGLRSEERLAQVPDVLRRVVIAPLHLNNLMAAYRRLGLVRSPWPSTEAAVEALALLARSTDPAGEGTATWGPWRPRHTAALAEIWPR
jgi:hypothetical protein